VHIVGDDKTVASEKFSGADRAEQTQARFSAPIEQLNFISK
jgi:hypothetical protein